MRTVAPSISLVTGAIRNSNSSPSASSTISLSLLSRRPTVSPGNSSPIADCSFRGSACLGCLKGGDPIGDELGIAFHPSEQGRAARVLPGEAEESQTLHVGYSTSVSQSPVRVEDGQVDPGVVGPVAGGPDHHIYLELAIVLKTNGAPGAGDGARLQFDVVATLELASARSDQRVAVFQPSAQARLDCRVDQTRPRQPPEEVAAGEALRQRCLPRADRENDLVGAGELLGELKTSVPAADDEDCALGNIGRPPISRAVRLPDLGAEVLGKGRNAWLLERAGGNNDLVGGDARPIEVEDEAPVVAGKTAHIAIELDRELEHLRIAFEVLDHLVPTRVAVRIAR